MSLISDPNGMVILDDLTAAPNGPGIVKQLADQVDAFYGSSVANTGALPATGKFPGQRVYVTDIATIVTWNAARSMWDGYWRTFTSTITGISGSAAAKYVRVGKKVDYEIVVTASSNSTAAISASLPTTADASHTNTARGVATAATSAFFTGLIFQNTTTTVTAVTAGALSQWGNSNPTAWANTNKLTLVGSYIEA